MAKQKLAGDVEIEVTAYLKHDGRDVRPGSIVTMAAEEARALIALGFARPVPATYRDRAMRSSTP